MAESAQYAIRGGLEGRQRLRILGRVMRDSSNALFDHLQLSDGLTCLDVGCGGGDATLDLARRVAPRGRVLGLDIDEVKVQLAREEALALDAPNVEFRCADVRAVLPADAAFDLVYARFLLTHLSDPVTALATFYNHVRPGGIIAIEDIDFTGHFTYPASDAFTRYQELYCAVVARRGGDPNIGLRLPLLLADAGCEHVEVQVAQPVAMQGEAKLLNPLTMESIGGAVVGDGLATRDEVDRLVAELYEFASNPKTVAGLPRVVQTWGRRPSD